MTDLEIMLTPKRELFFNLLLGCFFRKLHQCVTNFSFHRWMEVIRSATSSATRTRLLSRKESHAY